MGRPSLVTLRRAELLDAVEVCITAHGVAGTTVARIAELAGTQPSKVHHYLGSRDEMLAAAVERALANVEALVVEALRSTPPTDRLAAQLEVLFSPSLAAPEVNQLIDHLVAASYLDPSIRAAVQAMYQRFTEILLESITDAYPHADPAQRRRTAHNILTLAHATPTLEWLAVDPDNMQHNHAAALALLRLLAG